MSGVFLFGGMSSAQEADGPNEKAKRYHTLLLKRPGNPTVFSRFVDAWLDTGDKKEMKTWLEESAKAGGAAEWRVLAAFHEYLGEDEAALDAFNKAVKGDEKDAALRLARAKLHAKLLSFEAALVDLDIATVDEKLGVEASKLKGIYLARAGRIDEAVEAWKKVIERFPKDEELREDLIEVEVAEGLYDDAIAASQALVGMTKDPYKKALRQLRLGDIQILGNKREEGLKTYETIMAATGADTWLEREVLAQVERVFMREDDIQGLRDFFQKLREAHPRRVSVRKALARQMALNGEMDEAVALFQEVLKITPGDIGNREEFIAFLETNERWKEAREELAELLKLREEDPLLWERMAQIEEKQKNPEGVKTALAKVRDLKKGTPEGLIAVAALYTQAELLAEAEALLREGQGTYAESDEVTEALASFLMQNKKEAEALVIWTEMAKSADREGLLRVARSLTGHGKSDEAFKLLQVRMAEFGEDPLILGQFCNLAYSEEEAVVALPFGLALVRQANSPTDLEGAIKTAGRVLKRAGKQDATLRELEEKDGASISEQCLIADLYLVQGDTVKALEVLTAAEKADEGLLARFYRVRFDESRGELESAIASLRAIIELPEGRKTVHVRRLVGLLESSDDLPGALKAVDDWKRMAPGDQAAWTRRAELLSSHGEPDKAVLELRRMIGKFGAEEDSRAKLAGALLEANEHRSAQRIYVQLYEEGEDLTTKLKWVGELAKVAQREGTLDDLLADFERRKRENANSVAPLLALAEIHHSLNQYEERRSALLEASRRRPNDIKLLQHIADVEIRAGEFDRAVGLLKDAAKRDTTPGTKQKLADLFLKNGDFQEGLRLLKELPDQAGDPRKIETTVLSLMAMTEWDLAARYLSDFLPRHPEDWRLKYIHAIVLEMDGREEEAFEIHRGLMEVDSTIKGLKPLFDPKVYQRGYWLERANAPGAMTGWIELQIMSNFVESDTRTLSQLKDGYRRSFGRTLINLPGAAEEVQMMSFLKATQLVKSFEEEKQEATLESLSIKGVERIDLYRLSKGDLTKMFVKINELLDAEPDNPKFLGMWATYRGSAGKDFKTDPERQRRILGALAMQSPSEAITMVRGMLYREEIERSEVVTFLNNLLKAAPKGEERERLVVSLIYLLNREIVKDEKDEMKPLALSLIDEALAVEKKPKDFGWVNLCLDLAMNLGEQDSAMTLLNRVSGWLLEGNTASSLAGHSSSRNLGFRSSSQWGGSGSNRGTLSLPVYPQGQFKGLPQTVASLVAKKLNVTQVVSSKAVAERMELLALLEVEEEKSEKSIKEQPKPLEVFRGRTDEIEMPILRALVSASLGDEEAMPRFVKSVGESNNLDELNLASGYLWKKKQYGEAYEVLTRMRMLTLSRAQRMGVDGKLAMAGSVLSGKEELEWDREPAQRAALRLRKALVNANDRTALINILIKLGLQKEAEKLGKGPARKYRSSSSNRSSRSGVQGIVHLTADGRKDEAARAAAKLIKSYQKNRNSSYELGRLTETLVSLNMVEATLEKIHPGDSESVSRRLLYANLALAVDRKELARPIFESLVKDRPGMTEARIGLFMCLLKEERDYRDFLKEDDGKIDTESLLGSMTALWQRADNKLEETLAMLELTHGILDNLAPDPDSKRNLSWVPYCVLSCVNDSYYNGTSLGELFGSRENRSFDKTKTALFDAAAKKVFIAMLKHPQTAEQGFMMLIKSRENLALKDEAVLEHAQTALLEVIRRKNLANNSGYRGRQALWVLFRGNGSTSSYSLNDAPGPLDYLISNGKNDALLTDEMLAILKKNQPEKFASLTLARKIIAATPDEAGKLFADWFAKLEKGEDGKKKTAEQVSTDLVYFAESLLLFDLKPSVFTDALEDELIKIKVDQYNDPSGWTQLSSKWLRWITKNKDQVATREFIVKVCEAAMGPQKQWHILAKLGPNHIPDNYKRKVYSLAGKLNSYCTVDAAVLPVVELAMEYELEKFVQNFRVQNGLSQRLQKLQDPEELVAWIKSTGLLSKSSEEKIGVSTTLGLLGVIDAFPYRNTEQGKKMLEAIKPLELDPLLKQLVMARYQSSDQRTEAIAAAWEERVDLLTAMSEANEAMVSIKLKVWFPSQASSKIGPKLKAFLDSLDGKRLEEARKKAEQWLADGIEIDPDDYQGRKIWAEVIKIAELDPVLASKLVIEGLKVVQSNPAYNRYSSSSGGIQRSAIDYWSGSFFEKLIEDRSSVDLVGKIRVIDFVYRSEFGKQLMELQSSGNNFSHYLRSSVQSAINSHVVPKESKRKQVELAFAKWAKELTPAEEATFVSLVVPSLLQSWSFNSNDIVPVTKWADKELRKESELMAEALILIVQKGGAPGNPGEKRTAMLETSVKSMKKLLPLLDVPTPLAVDFTYSTMNASDGKSLFVGVDQWKWLTGVFTTHSNGTRNIALSRVFQILPFLARQEFPGKPAAAKELMDSMSGTLITPDLLLKFRNNQSSSATWVSSLLPLALAAEDYEMAKRLIQQNTQSFRGELALMMDVAAAIDAKTAAKLAPATTMLYRTNNLPTFTQKTPAAIARVVEALPQRDRFRFEVMVASLNDTKVKEKVAKILRSTRLQELAKRFVKEAPKDNGPRWQLLNIFGSDADCVTALADEFENEATKTSLSTAVTLQSQGGQSTNGQALVKIIERWLDEELKAGRPEVLIEQLDLLSKNGKGNNAYYIRYAGKRLTTKLSNYLLMEALSHPENAPAMAAFSRKNFEARTAFDQGSRDDEAKGAIWGDLFVHVLAGETKAWYERVEAIPEDDRAAYAGPLGKEDRWGVQGATQHEIYREDAHSKERKLLLTKVLLDPIFVEKVMTHYTRLSTFMDAGMIRKEELYKVIHDLPMDHERKAEFLMEKAGVMGWRDEKVNEAEKIYEKARELALTQKNNEIAHLCDALHARLLGQKKRISESWKFGQRVDPALLPEADQKWFGKDSKNWKEAALKKAAEPDPKLKEAPEPSSKEEGENTSPEPKDPPTPDQPIQPSIKAE